MKKKIVSVILACVMLIVCAMPAFAAAGDGETAFIVVSGMDNFPLYGESGEKLRSPETAVTVKMNPPSSTKAEKSELFRLRRSYRVSLLF